MGRKNRKPKINVFWVQCVDREWVHRSKTQPRLTIILSCLSNPYAANSLPLHACFSNPEMHNIVVSEMHNIEVSENIRVKIFFCG